MTEVKVKRGEYNSKSHIQGIWVVQRTESAHRKELVVREIGRDPVWLRFAPCVKPLGEHRNVGTHPSCFYLERAIVVVVRTQPLFVRGIAIVVGIFVVDNKIRIVVCKIYDRHERLLGREAQKHSGVQTIVVHSISEKQPKVPIWEAHRNAWRVWNGDWSRGTTYPELRRICVIFRRRVETTFVWITYLSIIIM